MGVKTQWTGGKSSVGRGILAYWRDGREI